jgi:hypothetical protein
MHAVLGDRIISQINNLITNLNYIFTFDVIEY